MGNGRHPWNLSERWGPCIFLGFVFFLSIFGEPRPLRDGLTINQDSEETRVCLKIDLGVGIRSGPVPIITLGSGGWLFIDGSMNFPVRVLSTRTAAPQ